MKKVFLLLLGMLLACCSYTQEPSSEQKNNDSDRAVEKQVANSSAKIPMVSAEMYRKLAPENWKLQEGSDDIGSFFVRTEHNDKREGRLLRGVIALDGRFESLTNPFRYRTGLIRQGQEKYGDVAPIYPHVEGFQKAVISPSIGYSSKLKADRRELRYLNREHGIYCLAYNPGKTRCFWGDEIVRYGLFFDSRDTKEALNYIASICFHGSGCPSWHGFNTGLPRVNEEDYRDITPPGWQLNLSTNGAAAFKVKVEQDDGPQGSFLDGTIALDNRFSRVESPLIGTFENPWRSWPAFYEFVQARGKRHAEVALEYADVEGFEKTVISLKGGYHGNSDSESHVLIYINRENGIYCRSHNPGDTRCFWGDENVRYGLSFDSRSTIEALNYLSSLMITSTEATTANF